MSNTTKCIVTGGAGFIGSHLCEALLASGYTVFCVDNLLTGSKKNIHHLTSNSNFVFLDHDVITRLPEKFRLLFSSKDIVHVYHLASAASPEWYTRYSIETLLANSVGTYNILQFAKEHRAKFLLTSTSEVYGDPLEHPQKETYWGNVNSVGVRSCYDEAKRFAESITMEYFRKFSLDIRIIRIFNTYGPRMQKDDGRVISNFINQALTNETITVYGSGNQTRSFCYVTDLVEGLIKAMESDKTKAQVINLGNPDERTVLQTAKEILRLTASTSKIENKPLPSDDPTRRKPDISKAIELLSWKPKMTFEEGLKKTISYFNSL